MQQSLKIRTTEFERQWKRKAFLNSLSESRKGKTTSDLIRQYPKNLVMFAYIIGSFTFSKSVLLDVILISS